MRTVKILAVLALLLLAAGAFGWWQNNGLTVAKVDMNAEIPAEFRITALSRSPTCTIRSLAEATAASWTSFGTCGRILLSSPGTSLTAAIPILMSR